MAHLGKDPPGLYLCDEAVKELPKECLRGLIRQATLLVKFAASLRYQYFRPRDDIGLQGMKYIPGMELGPYRTKNARRSSNYRSRLIHEYVSS